MWSVPIPQTGEAIVNIREGQIRAFRDYMFNAFVGRMVARLRAVCPEQTRTLDDDALRARIRSELRNASGFGIQQERNLETYLEYAIEYGSGFYETARFSGARRVLEDWSLDETEKMNRVTEYLVFG